MDDEIELGMSNAFISFDRMKQKVRWYNNLTFRIKCPVLQCFVWI